MANPADAPRELGASVGRHGTNRPDDVLQVRKLLGAIGEADGGTPFDLTDPATEAAALGRAIERFQRKQKLRSPDGKVDRGGATWQVLVEVALGLDSNRVLARVEGMNWQAWNHDMLPPLLSPTTVDHDWELNFGGYDGERPMESRAYLCNRVAGTPHIGVAWPQGVTAPSSYLLYFHHGIGQEAADYAQPDVRMDKGIGDYFIGRMRGMQQVARSGKNVGLIVPQPTFAGRGFLGSSEATIMEVLQEIDLDLSGGKRRELPPLLLASYSNGLEPLCHFMNAYPTLRQKVVAIFDFDGMLITGRPYDNLTHWASGGLRVVRYVGRSSPARRPKETNEGYLGRLSSLAPELVALPQSRWVKHPQYFEFKKSPTWAASWWMHFYIPSCMLYHGLSTTNGI